MDADARTDLGRQRDGIPGYVDRNDGSDDAAFTGPNAFALPARRRNDERDAPGLANRARRYWLLLHVDRLRSGCLSAGRRTGGDRDATTGALARRPDRRRCGCPDRWDATVHRVESVSSGLLPGNSRARL